MLSRRSPLLCRGYGVTNELRFYQRIFMCHFEELLLDRCPDSSKPPLAKPYEDGKLCLISMMNNET